MVLARFSLFLILSTNKSHEFMKFVDRIAIYFQQSIFHLSVLELFETQVE